MIFVFENLTHRRNFVDCPDLNPSTIQRFTPSPVATTMIRHNQLQERFENLNLSNIEVQDSHWAKFSQQPYIIASGVAHSPYDWCGETIAPNDTRKSLFSFLCPTYLEGLQTGRALLMLDQSHEGYQTDWLWSWFHTHCERYKISPSRIIYVTGNANCKSQYNTWCDQHGIKDRLHAVPSFHFERMIYHASINRVRFDHLPPLPSFSDQIQYKRSNLHRIKSYNALQKRIRSHRIWLLKKLNDNNLVHDGILSMNQIGKNASYMDGKFINETETDLLRSMLPLFPYDDPTKELDAFASQDSGKYLREFSPEITLNSWVTVISEASFSDSDNTCFVSEKTFKPFCCHHPFIVYGNKGSLQHLRDLGYKTFHPYINEDYDNYNTWERLEAVIENIKSIHRMTPKEKIKWYRQLGPILEHNSEIIRRNTISYAPLEMLEVHNIYQEFNNATFSD